MFRIKKQSLFKQLWETRLSDYVTAVAWSPDGTYLASGNNSRSLLMWEKDNSSPLRMQNLPGKVRQLTWAQPTVKGTSLLAEMSGEKIVVWARATNPSKGFIKVLDAHEGMVQVIAFRSNTLLLASAAENDCLYLWRKSGQIAQMLEGGSSGFSCLA